ncbi:hypothetical protein MRX96_000702 [Rhipicephalus microplus]
MVPAICWRPAQRRPWPGTISQTLIATGRYGCSQTPRLEAIAVLCHLLLHTHYKQPSPREKKQGSYAVLVASLVALVCGFVVLLIGRSVETRKSRRNSERKFSRVDCRSARSSRESQHT